MGQPNMRRVLPIEDIKGNKEIACALLKAKHPLFIDEVMTINEKDIILEGIFLENMYDWYTLKAMPMEEKVRHLMNCGYVYDQLKKDNYTYIFSPEHIVFTMNGIPKLTHRGIEGQVEPYDQIQEAEFLAIYQAMIISLLDEKVEYAALRNGKLPFYKGDLLCEAVKKASRLNEILQLLNERYIREKEMNRAHYTRVRASTLSKWKIATGFSSTVAALSVIGIMYVLLVSLPKHEAISDIRLAFIQQDYSNVRTTAKSQNSQTLSQEDKYIIAYSVIMSEPLTDAQKKELSRISPQSNAEYLRYWVLIGQDQLDEAMDIASFLDDPQLLMYSLTKKIDDIQRNPNLKSAERTEAIQQYKSKLEELQKIYLPSSTDEHAPSTTTDDSQNNNTPTSNGQ